MLAFLSHIDEIRGHLGAAKMQTIASDDRIIAGHVSDALAIADTIRREMVAAGAPDLLADLKALLESHVRLVSSGDCGFWDVEKEDEVIAARAAIAKAEGR